MAQPFAFFGKAGAFQRSENKIPALSLQRPEGQGQGTLVSWIRKKARASPLGTLVSEIRKKARASPLGIG